MLRSAALMSKEEEQSVVGSLEDLIQNGDIIEIPKNLPDFTDDIGGLADVIVKNWAPDNALCLGELHGFYLIYDGVSLGLTHPEIDEEQIKKLQEVFKNFIKKTASASFDDNFPGLSILGGYPTLPVFPVGEVGKLRVRYDSESSDITKAWILDVALYHEARVPKDRTILWLNNVATILNQYREGLPIEFTIEPVRQSESDLSPFVDIPQRDVLNVDSTASGGFSGFMRKLFRKN